MRIRPATADDAAACAAIYAPYVAETAISFEIVPPDRDEMARRIAVAAEHHAWLVLEDDGRVVGYAYGGRYKEREAYRWACEVSVYVERGRRRSGAGRALYEALFERLSARGYRTAVAGMTLPNDASAGLHARWASSSSAPTAGSATRTACGTTSRGPSARWRTGPSRLRNYLERAWTCTDRNRRVAADRPRGGAQAGRRGRAGRVAGLRARRRRRPRRHRGRRQTARLPGSTARGATSCGSAPAATRRARSRASSPPAPRTARTRSACTASACSRSRARVLRVSDLEALDGTPIVDVKPVLGGIGER